MNTTEVMGKLRQIKPFILNQVQICLRDEKKVGQETKQTRNY